MRQALLLVWLESGQGAPGGMDNRCAGWGVVGGIKAACACVIFELPLGVGETLAQGPGSWSSPSLSSPVLRKGPSHYSEGNPHSQSQCGLWDALGPHKCVGIGSDSTGHERP